MQKYRIDMPDTKNDHLLQFYYYYCSAAEHVKCRGPSVGMCMHSESVHMQNAIISLGLRTPFWLDTMQYTRMMMTVTISVATIAVVVPGETEETEEPVIRDTERGGWWWTTRTCVKSITRSAISITKNRINARVLSGWLSQGGGVVAVPLRKEARNFFPSSSGNYIITWVGVDHLYTLWLSLKCVWRSLASLGQMLYRVLIFFGGGDADDYYCCGSIIVKG